MIITSSRLKLLINLNNFMNSLSKSRSITMESIYFRRIKRLYHYQHFNLIKNHTQYSISSKLKPLSFPHHFTSSSSLHPHQMKTKINTYSSQHEKAQEQPKQISNRGTHLTYTENISREPIRGLFKLKEINFASSSTKQFRFKIEKVYLDKLFDDHCLFGNQTDMENSFEPETFQFKPGQWVDLFVPSMYQVGGFSITSTPLQLKKFGHLDLAVKYHPNTKNAIVKWLHHDAQPGSEVYMRIGGKFFLNDPNIRALFLAGGVGIAPLFSMIQHLHEGSSVNVSNTSIETTNLATSQQSKTDQLPKGLLMYSSKQDNDLLFYSQLQSMHPTIQSQFFVSQNKDSKYHGRVQKKDIQKALESLSISKTSPVDIYLCGPPLFEKAMIEFIEAINHPHLKLYHEKWW